MQLLLLGPQRRAPVLKDALRHMRLKGRMAMVTAGWQEHESEDGELRSVIGKKAVNLGLYGRANALFEEDRELFEAHRAKQDELKQIQRFYRDRLNSAMAVYERFLTLRSEPPRLLEEATASVLEDIRRLDGEHLDRVLQNRKDFAQRTSLYERPSVLRHRKEVKALVDGASGIAIAGGHVAILLNRLRFFGMRDLLQDKPVIAWSAGAMALSNQIVLFHDRPAQGPGYAEVLDAGLSLFNGVIPFPRAKERLRVDDPSRVAHLARRFAPARCVPLEPDMWAELTSTMWRSYGARQFTRDGENIPWSSGVDAPAEMP